MANIVIMKEQLARVQRRIAEIEEGVASYGIGTRNLHNHELTTLYNREKELLAAIDEAEASENGGLHTFAQLGTL